MGGLLLRRRVQLDPMKRRQSCFTLEKEEKGHIGPSCKTSRKTVYFRVKKHISFVDVYFWELKYKTEYFYGILFPYSHVFW